MGIGFLTGYLNLTDAQKTQAETIFEAAKTASEPLRGRMASARESLQDAVKTGKSDAEIDTIAASIGVLSGQLTAIQSKAMVRFRAILTPEQIQKLDSRPTRRGPRSGD
jgi:Spy/CpxP family protein refolding chaperone